MYSKPLAATIIPFATPLNQKSTLEENTDNNSIDKASVEKMKDLLGKEFPRIISGFMADIEVYIKEIGEALQTGNREQISKIAHKLKSSAGQFGFLRMQEIARALENNKKLEINILSSHHAELKASYKEVSEFLKSS